MRSLRITVALLGTCACASAQAAVPNSTDVQQALAEMCPTIGKVAKLHCADFSKDGEPTEATCSYTVSNGSKQIKDQTYFAVDSTGWHLTDMPAHCPGKK